MTKPHIKKIIKHVAKFNNKNDNKCLRLADDFLQSNPELLYWTERNDSKKGLFYKYHSGVYKPLSGLEVDDWILDYEPTQPDILIPKSLSSARFEEVIRYIKKRRYFYREDFNQENIVNFRNGFFDVIEGDLMPHTMEIVSTIQLPYEYDAKADCPIFKKVVSESLEEDTIKMMILQEFMGYCLIQSTKYERGLFIVGAAGSGKSTVLDSIEAMLGHDNVSSIRMDMLADSRFTGQLLDKLANIDNEIPRDMQNYEEALKKIISGQKVTIDTKFVPTYCAYPKCKLIFAANDLPHINDSSDGVFRRMLLLYFNNVVDRDKIDFDLKQKIKDSECPGIFNWAYEGLQRLNKNKKFTYSMTMEEQIRDLKLLNNSIYYFVNENYEVTGNKEDWIDFEQLYDTYKRFCVTIGARGVFKKNVFGKELMKVFVNKIFSDRKTLGGIQKRIYTGLRLLGSEPVNQDELDWEE